MRVPTIKVQQLSKPNKPKSHIKILVRSAIKSAVLKDSEICV